LKISAQRQLYIHSLSYQLRTLTRDPPAGFGKTLVERPSTMEEYGSEMISEETIGSSVYLMIPTSGPDSVAALRAALTSAAVQAFLTLTVTSTMEPVTVGTRMERPSMDFGGRA